MSTRKLAFYYDYNKYHKALRAECRRIMLYIKKRMYEETVRNIEVIRFNRNEVRLGDGEYTSDALRKRALIKSIIYEPSRLVWENNGSKLRLGLSAMGSDFKDTHIGWFYEYGTGTQYRAPSIGIRLPPSGDTNKWRSYYSNEPIRTRTIRYNRGRWTDMGGNERITYSVKGGERVPDRYETEAHRWMTNAFNSVSNEALLLLSNVPIKVNPTKFIEARNLRFK